MRRALKYYWPILAVLVPNFAFSVYLAAIRDGECQTLLGNSTSLLALYQFGYALPGMVFLCSIYTLVIGVNGFKQGKYPPDGFPLLPGKVSYGLAAKLVNLGAVLFPLFAAYLVFLGFDAIESMSNGRSHGQFNRDILAQCAGN